MDATQAAQEAAALLPKLDESTAVLGIETSCDDTAAAVVCADGTVLAHASRSSWPAHAQAGGIVPRTAGNAHTSMIIPVVKAALSAAASALSVPPVPSASAGPLRPPRQPVAIRAVAITRGPGLAPSLAAGAAAVPAVLALVRSFEQHRRRQHASDVPVSNTSGSGCEGKTGGAAECVQPRADPVSVAVLPTSHLAGHVLAARLADAAHADAALRRMPVYLDSPDTGVAGESELPSCRVTPLQVWSMPRVLDGGLSDPAAVHSPTGVDFPYLCLLASGGHCELVLARSAVDFVRLGTALDDAPGEAFDKAARHLGLDAEAAGSGGAAIELAAQRWWAARQITSRSLQADNVPALPRLALPMVSVPNAHFSFSGLKTALMRLAKARGALTTSARTASPLVVDALAAGFQFAVAMHIQQRVMRAVLYARTLCPSLDTLVAGGGVACNALVRSCLPYAGVGRVALPPPELCRDNAAMIAWAALEELAHVHGERRRRESRTMGPETTESAPAAGLPWPWPAGEPLTYTTRMPLGRDGSTELEARCIRILPREVARRVPPLGELWAHLEPSAG
jgi:tRNA A37 threonylcarbamoyltransferase TsaD